jgi:hypothetical protein
MKIVKVVYTVNPEFAVINSDNIKLVMNDLRKINHPGISYNACLGSDRKTFTHTAFFRSAEEQKLLNELPSFKNFQEQLKMSGLEVAPKQDFLELIGSSVDILSNE